MVSETNAVKATVSKAFSLFVALILALTMFTPFAAYAADDTVYETWDEYKTAEGADGVTWNMVANEMDKVIDAAYEAYENGDADEAYRLINNCGYYGWYETTGFERTVMGSISGARVSEVELAFSTTRSTAKKGGSLEDFKAECDNLKSLLHEDANKLDGVSGDQASSTVDLGYEPDDVVYDTWDDFTKARPDVTATWNVVANEMDKVIDAAYEAYENGDAGEAYRLINNCGYYGWYETTGFERTVMGSISGARVSEVELAFSTTRSTAKKGGSLEDFKAECDNLKSLLHEDANKLDGVDTTATASADGQGSAAVASVGGGYGSEIATFIAAFGIIVREGIEAILVIGAIIAYLVKSGNKKSLRQVYIGAVLGIVCSFIAAWLLTITLSASQAPQEIIEGFTALFAVVVLFWVSNWMLSKSESKAWDNYIQKQVESSVSKGSVFALAFTAWLAVFREGAEVILFYQPIVQDGTYLGSMWLGFGLGCVVIAVIFVLMRFFSVRLPLKPFFMAMSILMYIMCIAFLGSGIKELIEGGLISATNLGWFQDGNELLNVLGIHPIAETLIPQIILTVICVVSVVLQIRSGRKLAAATGAAADEKSDAKEDGESADAVTQPSPEWDGVTTWEEYERQQAEQADHNRS